IARISWVPVLARRAGAFQVVPTEIGPLRSSSAKRGVMPSPRSDGRPRASTGAKADICTVSRAAANGSGGDGTAGDPVGLSPGGRTGKPKTVDFVRVRGTGAPASAAGGRTGEGGGSRAKFGGGGGGAGSKLGPCGGMRTVMPLTGSTGRSDTAEAGPWGIATVVAGPLLGALPATIGGAFPGAVGRGPTKLPCPPPVGDQLFGARRIRRPRGPVGAGSSASFSWTCGSRAAAASLSRHCRATGMYWDSHGPP